MSMYKFNPYYVFLLIIACSISLQFDYLFFNIYFFIPFFVIISTFYATLLTPIKSTNSIAILLIFFSVLTVTVFAMSISNVSGFRRTIIYVGYVILSVYVINKFLYEVDKHQIEKLIRLTLYLCLTSVIIETYFRFNFPTLDLRGESFDYISRVANTKPTFIEMFSNQYFYAFKFSSIMFFDSNFVGIFLIPLLVLNLFYIEINKSKKFKATLVLILILIFLTFSRSAIITAAMILYIYCLYIFNRKSKYMFFFILNLSVFIFSASLIYLYPILIQDGSFNTKLDIFSSLNTISEHNLINILFGYGVEAGGTVYSYKEGAYAHALIPLLLGQFGLIGLFLYLSVLAYLSYKAGFFGWLLFLVIMLSGLSLADPWQILNYFVFLIIGHARRLDTRGIKYERN